MTDAETFDAAVSDAVSAALDAGVDPVALERVLQRHAQDMRELDDWQRQQEE